MPEIKFAVWNIDGALSNSQNKTEDIDNRIKRLLDNRPDLDFIFFLEIPNPSRLKALPSGWISCREDPETTEGKSGILLYKTARNKDLCFERKPLDGSAQDPVGAVYSIGTKEGGNFFFAGFWNIPPEGDRNYFSHLQGFLESVLKQYPICCIAGDTNVNVRTEATPEGTNDGRKLEAFLNEKNMCIVQDELDDYTLHFKGKGHGWYRCDLLIVPTALRHRFCSFSIGKPEIYMENGGSDHLPLFFSYSYNSPEEEK